MKKQYDFCRMALLLCAWLFSSAAYAEIETGICGSDLTWTLNTETGVLEISGTGEMFNYSNQYSSSGSAPWCSRGDVKTVIIGDGVTSIGDYAFYWLLMERVMIGKQVATIGKGAFQGCTLSSVTIPGNVKVIGDDAFAYDTYNLPDGLAQITIEDGVVSIGNSAFWGNNELTAVTIPQSVTTIGDEAFSDCKNLKSVTIQGNLQHLGRKAFPYKTLDIITGDIVLDGRCIIIGDTLKAFASKGAIQYSIPDDEGIAFIGDYAFEECTDLQSVEIPQGVTAIGSSAFSNCTGLTEITIPNGVTALGDKVFYRCTHLQSVTIPNSMESIGDEVFSDCTDLETFEGKFASADHRCLVVNDTLKYFAPKNLTRYTIPDDVTVIEKAAFSGGVQKKTLVEITIPRSVVTIEYGAFSGCPYLKEVWFNADSCISGGFSGCEALTTVHIGENVKRIPDEAFNWRGLTEVWFNADSCISGGFSGCEALTTVHIGENVKRIPDKAFSGCTGLKEITVPESVTTIGIQAFYGCMGLEKFEGKFATDDHCSLIVNDTLFIAFAPKCGVADYAIPDGVTTIGGWAFSGCTGLTSVTIPKSVTSIGFNAFSGCTGLTSVTVYNTTPPEIYYESFSDIAREDTLYVPSGSVDKYRYDYAWNNSFSEILPIEGYVPEAEKDFEPSDITPDNGAEVTALKTFTLIFTEKPALAAEAQPITLAGKDTLLTATLAVGDGNTLAITLADTLKTAGEYTLTIPESTFGDAAFAADPTTGRCNPELTYTYYVVEDTVPDEPVKPETVQDFKPSGITPTDSSEVEALKTFTLEFAEKPSLAAEAQPITLAGNDTLLTATLSVGSGNTLAITLADTLKTVGEYTLTIPEGAFGDADFAADPTVGHCNPELVYTYTIKEPEPVEPDEPENPDKPDEPIVPDEPSSITETQADAGHITVYNLQGVLVLETNDAADLKTLQNGAYIVNGKKMIIAR